MHRSITASLEARERVLQLRKDSEADVIALALTQTNLADAYRSLAELDHGDLRSLSTARDFFDARIETCKELVRRDPANLYARALLRKCYFSKADFLSVLDRSEQGISEARNLLSCALVLSPETIRDEELPKWHKCFEQLGMRTEWEILSVGRAAFRKLGVYPKPVEDPFNALHQ